MGELVQLHQQPVDRLGQHGEHPIVHCQAQAGCRVIQLVGQLGPHPQGGRAAERLARCQGHLRAAGRDAVLVAPRSQREQRGLILLRHPGTQEIVLGQGHPATGDLLVERAILDEIRILALLVLFFRAVPRRTVQAERFRVGEAGLHHGGNAFQAALDVTCPGRRAAVDQHILDLNGVTATGKGEGSLQLHAVGGIGHEPRLDTGGAIDQADVARIILRLQDQFGTIVCPPNRLGHVEPAGIGVEQHHGFAARGSGLPIPRQLRVGQVAPVEFEGQHIVAQAHLGRGLMHHGLRRAAGLR